MFMGTLAIGIANLLWTSAIAPTSGSQQLINMGDPDFTSTSNAMGLARDMFYTDVCVYYYMERQATQEASGVPLAASDIMSMTQTPNGGYSWGTKNIPDVCGTLKIDQDNYSGYTGSSTRGGSSLLGFRVASVNYDAIASGMLTAYSNAANSLLADVHTISAKWIRDNAILSSSVSGAVEVPLDYAAMLAATKKFQALVNSGVTTSTASRVNAINAEAQQNMSMYGWMSAGAWYATFAEINTAMANAVKATSIYAGMPQVARVPDTNTFNMLRRASSAFVNAEAKSGSNLNSGVNGGGAMDQVMKDTGCGGAVLNSIAGSATGNCSMGQAIVSKMIKTAAGGTLASSSVPNVAGVPLTNPIIMFKNAGDYVMTISSAIISAPYVAKAAIWVADKLPVIPGVASLGQAGKSVTEALGTDKGQDAGAWLTSFAWTMLFCGMLMSLYIPMIPFIIWMGSCTGYAASFLEGLIAMPLHSFSHLNTDGEGMGQGTSHGYLFMLNTIARPSLMVISFFIASALVIVLGTFSAALFLPAMANVQGNSMTGIASVVGLLGIFIIINVTLINACFELIHVIPDQVIGFIGSGSVNTHLGKDTEGKINGMFGVVVRGGRDGILGANSAQKAAQTERAKDNRAKLFGGGRSGPDSGAGG
jgi:conjugal transfer/type IV secretion protein DotA/TraY